MNLVPGTRKVSVGGGRVARVGLVTQAHERKEIILVHRHWRCTHAGHFGRQANPWPAWAFIPPPICDKCKNVFNAHCAGLLRYDPRFMGVTDHARPFDFYCKYGIYRGYAMLHFLDKHARCLACAS